MLGWLGCPSLTDHSIPFPSLPFPASWPSLLQAPPAQQREDSEGGWAEHGWLPMPWPLPPTLLLRSTPAGAPAVDAGPSMHWQGTAPCLCGPIPCAFHVMPAPRCTPPECCSCVCLRLRRLFQLRLCLPNAYAFIHSVIHRPPPRLAFSPPSLVCAMKAIVRASLAPPLALALASLRL